MDYNIYIRSVEGGGYQNPTTPWDNRESPTKPWKPTMQQVENSLNLPVSPSLIAKGVNAVAKAAPWVLLAKAVFDMVSTMSNNIMPYFANETGDYRLTRERENVKNYCNWIFQPFQSIASHHNAEQQIRLEDDRRAQNRLLLGDSVLNERAKVGV